MHSTEVPTTWCYLKYSVTYIKWVDQLLSKASLTLVVSEANKDGSFFTPPSRMGKRAARLLSQAVTAVYTIGSLAIIVCSSADFNSISLLLHTIITSGNSDAKLNKLTGPTVSPKHTVPSVYIQAWVTMGKIFLVDGKLANNFIPLFVQVWPLTWHYSIPTVLKN